ncbi:MAG: hypothetical protein KH135_04505 [Firmicutes bacterium]|nr:hypothetical protein [Bacillota bacterium]
MKIASNVTKQMEKELKRFSSVDFPSQAICQLIINNKKYNAVIECHTIVYSGIIINQKFKYCIYDMEISEELYNQFVAGKDIKINRKKYYSGIVSKMFCDDLKKKNHMITIGSLYFIEY